MARNPRKTAGETPAASTPDQAAAPDGSGSAPSSQPAAAEEPSVPPASGVADGDAGSADESANDLALSGAQPEEANGARDPLGPEADLDSLTIAVRSVAKQGRWRIGRHFTHEPVTIAVDDLDEDQIGRLLADPELIVAIVAVQED